MRPSLVVPIEIEHDTKVLLSPIDEALDECRDVTYACADAHFADAFCKIDRKHPHEFKVGICSLVLFHNHDNVVGAEPFAVIFIPLVGFCGAERFLDVFRKTRVTDEAVLGALALFWQLGPEFMHHIFKILVGRDATVCGGNAVVLFDHSSRFIRFETTARLLPMIDTVRRTKSIGGHSIL